MSGMGEHPVMCAVNIKHDSSTISWAVGARNDHLIGKVFKIEDGIAKLPDDGEAFDGVITAVHQNYITGQIWSTGTYVYPAKAVNGDVVTIAQNDRLVAGVDASDNNAKGFVKPAPKFAEVPASFSLTSVRTYVANMLPILEGQYNSSGKALQIETDRILISLPR